MRKRAILILTLGVMAGCERSDGSGGRRISLLGGNEISSITLSLSEQVPRPRTVEITDPQIISRFVDSSSFVRQAPCACAHVMRVEAKTSAGQIRFSICDHCVHARDGNFAMNPAFYRLFTQHIGVE